MTNTTPAKFTKLVTLLKELFQLDQPDLDFGIYRIMHAKAGEVSAFLERELLPQVKDAFAQYQSADKAALQTELAKAFEQAQALGADPESLPKVKELRQRIASESVDIGALENDTYDHLFSFFRRYYSEGDFLAKRVYKPGVYAIPYEGEEVTLHWANKDQYYIKTSEYLRDYAFRLKPEAGEGEDPMRMHFKLVDAAEGEHGNVKAAEGKDRVFVLVGEDCIGVGNGELEIRFEYRPATLEDWPADQRAGKKKPPAQKELTAFAVERIFASGGDFAGWLAELKKSHVKADGEQADYTRLEAHLRRYTARNTFDYFIHKDLGGFLRRELDFYIKNEVMHLDDVESETVPKVEQYLSKIKVIRRIAGKIIDFLAQLENFQKKLWLKKKFVVGSNWLVAISQVPDELLPEVCANVAQLEEWKALHSLHELPSDVTRPAYSEPLTPEYLKAHSSLMVDTRHFDAAFVARLLDEAGDLDEKADGVLVHSENFQALSLMQAHYRKKVQCIYIDPPYNTGGDGFAYKDHYQRSSWLSMASQVLSMSRLLMDQGSAFFASCDDNEVARARELLDCEFGAERLESQIIVQSNKRGQTYKSIARTHEYLLSYGNDDLLRLNGLPKEVEDGPTDEMGQYEYWELRNRNPKFGRFNRPNLFYPIFASQNQVAELGVSRVSVERTDEYSVEILPRNSAGDDSCWRWSAPKVDGAAKDGLLTIVAKQTRAGDWRVFEKSRKSYTAPKSIWSETDVINEKGTVELGAMGLKNFGFPKPTGLLEKVVRIGSPDDGLTLDYFAGSGTTGHAAISLNREDAGQQKFVLVEQGDHFDSVLMPRINKVTFTPDWKDGKPKRLATEEEAERSPRLIKVLRLESYEDTLNNLALSRSTQQQAALDFGTAQGADGLREQYLLRYQLYVESQGSASLLNIAAFSDPTAYKLLVKTPGSDESREVNVDLLETFNWLLGLTVQHIAAPRSFAVGFERDGEGRLQINGRLKQHAAGPWWFRTVTGTTPEGRRTLVIWRKLTDDAEQDNLVLETWFRDKQAFSVRDTEFDLIYVNGDNTLENIRLEDESWKVRLTEEDFQRLMFEGTEA